MFKICIWYFENEMNQLLTGMLVDIGSVFHPISEEETALIVMDDLWSELINSRAFSNLVTFGSRHNNCTLLCTTQNMFESAKYSVTIRRNFQILVVFYPAAERQMLVTIGKNLFPSNPLCLINCFKKLIPYTKSPYEQYILIDTHPNSPLGHDMRLRSNIFDQEEPYFFIVSDD